MSYVIQGPAWVLLNPGSLPDFQSHPLAFPLTLFISALDLWALVLLFKYFQIRNIFPQKSLAQGSKQAVLWILNVMHELVELRVHPDPPGTRVLISTRNSCKSFPMVYSYTHALIRGLLTERQSFLFKRRGHTISTAWRDQKHGPITDKTPSQGNPANSSQWGKKNFPMYSLEVEEVSQGYTLLDIFANETGFCLISGWNKAFYRFSVSPGEDTL